MISPAGRAEGVPRHTLVFVAPQRWRRLITARPDLAEQPTVTAWVDHGWPLIVRRPEASDVGGFALGLPLPPTLGKRRIAVTMPPEDVVETRPPPLLDEARAVAPAAWADTMEQVAALANVHCGPARVFGSLAWQWITGLTYLSASSDLDLLLPCPEAGHVERLVAGLAAVDASAPLRIDAELVRPDGTAVNWREWQTGSDNVLVKSLAGVAMVSRKRFLAGFVT